MIVRHADLVLIPKVTLLASTARAAFQYNAYSSEYCRTVPCWRGLATGAVWTERRARVVFFEGLVALEWGAIACRYAGPIVSATVIESALALGRRTDSRARARDGLRVLRTVVGGAVAGAVIFGFSVTAWFVALVGRHTHIVLISRSTGAAVALLLTLLTVLVCRLFSE